MSEFSLDSRLSADTKPIFSFEKSELFLMNDARWPWLIVVPTIPDSFEWHELEEKSGQLIDQDVSLAAKVLKQITNCEKINIASLGNMVRQLHIHIVARDIGDPNWPNPV
ncbi:MAG: HIT domain-containing protein, partial [Pseudomonadota bacterium]